MEKGTLRFCTNGFRWQARLVAPSHSTNESPVPRITVQAFQLVGILHQLLVLKVGFQQLMLSFEHLNLCLLGSGSRQLPSPPKSSSLSLFRLDSSCPVAASSIQPLPKLLVPSQARQLSTNLRCFLRRQANGELRLFRFAKDFGLQQVLQYLLALGAADQKYMRRT